MQVASALQNICAILQGGMLVQVAYSPAALLPRGFQYVYQSVSVSGCFCVMLHFICQIRISGCLIAAVHESPLSKDRAWQGSSGMTACANNRTGFERPGSKGKMTAEQSRRASNFTIVPIGLYVFSGSDLIDSLAFVHRSRVHHICNEHLTCVAEVED